MLTVREQLLIAAAVGGDLTPDRARAFRQLIAEKPDAAPLFRRLKQDAARLRTLTPRPAPPNVLREVMKRVAEVTPLPPAEKPTPDRRTRRAPNWPPLLIAASVILAVAAGSYAFFQTTGRPDEYVVRVLTPVRPRPAEVVIAAAKPGPTDLDATGTAKPVPGDSQLAGGVKSSSALEVIPAPRTVVVQSQPVDPPEVFTVGEWIANQPLAEAKLQLPLLVDSVALNDKDVIVRVRNELARHPAFRVDLFSRKPTVAVDLFVAAARAAGVDVTVDTTSAELMKKSVEVTYAVYLDNLTSNELARLLAEYAAQAEKRKDAAALFGAAHVIPASAIEARDVREMIGVELVPSKSSAKPPATSISDKTLPMVVSALKKPGAKAAVVVTFQPNSVRTAANKSAEVKQFQAKRGDRKPGSVPALIVFRP